ncbi:MAG: hypothetical protein A2Y86_00100 [Candidatus Aminicenantes bacterium RBG_13_62_12]|nr:MAG: hypothetical protein A2Y86_00100 [Candidatus Aminicenantes bacterium RBG_13_62_12]
MIKKRFLLGYAVVILAVSLAPLAVSQEKADTAKILGNWGIDVYAGDQTYSLKLAVTEENGQLAGKISESMGSFTDVAISEISYDSVTFRFSFVGPTPPDGNSRTIKAEFKVAADTMGGTVSVPDLDFVADASASRSK